MPRNRARNREPQNQGYEPWTDWFCSIRSISRDAVTQPQYAQRYAYWEDGGMVKQVLYYEDGDGWRLHWWDSKGEGPEDSPDWDTWVLNSSIPMEFGAASNNIEAAVGEFKNKTKPGTNFPFSPSRISPWQDGYRETLFIDKVDRLKGPPLEACR